MRPQLTIFTPEQPRSITICADWRDVLPTLIDGEFDLCVADPPYYKGIDSKKRYGGAIGHLNIARVNYPVVEHWDIPQADFFQAIERVSLQQIVWGCNYYDIPFGPGRIVWDKCNGKTSFSDCELAYCSVHDSVRLFRYMWNGHMQGKSVDEGHIMQGNKAKNEKRIHITQKPVNLYRWTFRQYAFRGARVLDTHLGSGSSRIAAHEMGIDFLGIDKSPQIFREQEERFAEYLETKKTSNQINTPQ